MCATNTVIMYYYYCCIDFTNLVRLTCDSAWASEHPWDSEVVLLHCCYCDLHSYPFPSFQEHRPQNWNATSLDYCSPATLKDYLHLATHLSSFLNAAA